ncbi:MAG: TylF/MycF/NovP-related O-methyltransferase [Candidatus Scalinduaceae bacterium]
MRRNFTGKLFKRTKYLLKKKLHAVLNDPDLYEFNYSREVKDVLQRAFTFASSNLVSGDYYEFGIYNGRSFLFALREAAKRPQRNIHCYGFDSFKGLSELHPVHDGNKDDITGRQKWVKGDYACSKDDLVAKLCENKISNSSYTLIEGFYEDSLTKSLQEKMGKTAIVHIDCDLYEPTKKVLWFIKPLLQDGTILIFDDYYCFKGNKNKGEARAFSEFLEQHQDIEATLWYRHHIAGAAFIVTTNESTTYY